MAFTYNQVIGTKENYSLVLHYMTFLHDEELVNTAMYNVYSKLIYSLQHISVSGHGLLGFASMSSLPKSMLDFSNTDVLANPSSP